MSHTEFNIKEIHDSLAKIKFLIQQKNSQLQTLQKIEKSN